MKTLLLPIVLVVAYLGCTNCASSGMPAIKPKPGQSVGKWTVEAEVKRASEAIVGTYDGLSENDERDVPPEAQGVARAARLAVLMVTARMLIALSTPEELEWSKGIAGQLWQAIEAQRNTPLPQAPSLPNEPPPAPLPQAWRHGRYNPIDISTTL